MPGASRSQNRLSSSLLTKVGSRSSHVILDIGNYFHNRILRWAGHVARMPMDLAPQQLVTGWISHSRTRTNTNPNGTENQCCGQKWECACVAQTKQVWNDSGGEGAHGHTCDVASPTKNPIMKVTVDVKNAQTTEDTPRTR